jgi:hypothetical protein
MKRKLTKKEQEAYRFVCKLRYYGTLIAYFSDFLVKLYLILVPIIAWFDLKRAFYFAIAGALLDFTAKWFHLKNTKFRKNGYFKRKRR